MKIQPIRQDSLGVQVAAELRRLIATRRIASGTLVAEESLAGQFGLSRGPIREAIRTLTNEGLIESNGRRSTIRGLTVEDIDELFSLRYVLESAALEWAMERDLDHLVRLMDDALREMESAVEGGSAEEFADADLRFHSSLYIVAGHRRLKTIWDQYRPGIHLVLLASRTTYSDLRPSIESHYRLRNLIAAGDLKAARTDLADHLNNARGRVREFYATETKSTQGQAADLNLQGAES